MTSVVAESDRPSVRMGLFLSGWLNPAATRPSEVVDALLPRAELADAVGFSSVWVGQHILAEPWPVLDTSVYLGRLSSVSSRLEIGGVYLLPLSHPVRLAESLVSLDNISAGRFLCCPTLGWAQREFSALGVSLSERSGRFEETLQIMQKLWYTDEPFDFCGKYFSFRNLRMTARPERPGGIPIWIGASSPKAVRRAARLGDTWLGSSHTPYAVLSDLCCHFNDALAEVDRRPVRRPLLRHCMVASTDELAEERFTAAYNAYYRALGSWGIFREVVGDSHAPDGQDGKRPPGRAVVGSADSVIHQLREYMNLGFNEFIFQIGLPGTLEAAVRESLELLGSEVLPGLRALTEAETGPGTPGGR